MGKHGWTVVQHSGFGYAGNPQFEAGLESRQIESERQRQKIEKIGGLIFSDYGKAEDFCMDAMYPDTSGGITPNARGTFSKEKVDGLAIYIPVRTVVG